MGDMDSSTCLLDIIDDPSALSEFFKQGPDGVQVPVQDNTDDLDELTATLWDDDPNFVSSTTTDINVEGLSSASSFSQPTLFTQSVQSASTFAPTTPSPSAQLQQIVGVQSTISGSSGTIQVASPYNSAAPSPIQQAHGSPQVISQAQSPMAPGTSASPMLQLPATSTGQQQVFLHPTATAPTIQQMRQVQTVQISPASPSPSNVVNIGQVVRPVTPAATQVQLRPQQVVQTGNAQGGQVSLQGTIIQTSTGSHILIQQPVVQGQTLNLANLPGLQIRPQVQATQVVQPGQVIQTANNPALAQGVQQTQIVQQTPVQNQVLQTNPAQVVQQGQLLQPGQQVLQTHNTQVLQSAQQGQVVQQQNIQQAPILQQNVLNQTTVQPQPQQGQAIATSGGIQIAGNQLPPGVSVVNINGQLRLIQRAVAPGNQNIILRAVPNVIQIQAPTPSTVNQVAGQVSSQPQLLITQPSGQIQQSQIQIPTSQLTSLGQPQVLGDLNVLNNSQNVNFNVNILPPQGQGSASQALQQLQQNKVQLAGGAVVQTVQGSNPTTPIKILPKGNTAGNLQSVNIQQIQQHLVKPVISTVGSATTGTIQNTATQQVLNPVPGQDILSAAAALNDIPLQVPTPTSQSIKPVMNTATSIPNNSSSNLIASQVQPVKVEQKPFIPTLKVEPKITVPDVKIDPAQTSTEVSQTMQSTVLKTTPAQSLTAQISLPQQQITSQNSVGSMAPIGSASQGLQALAANSGGTTQTVTIHHQPLQPKLSGTNSNTALQQISIPAISQGSVVTTMATINPSGSQETVLNATSSSVVLNRSHPAPNVNIANMPHLQTLPPKAAMLVQNTNSGTSNSSITTLSTALPTVASSTAPTIIPTQVTPQVVTSKVVQPGAAPGSHNINVNNAKLLQRIHQQIKILLSIPNRTEQQQKMLQQLAQIEKKITSQASGVASINNPLKISQEQNAVTTDGQQGKPVVIPQQVVKATGVSQPSSTAIVNTSVTGAVSTPQLVVASVQPTLPGASKLIFTSTSSVGGVNSLQGLQSTTTSTALAAQKPNVVKIQTGTTHLKIAPGMSTTTSNGLIQLRPFLPAQSTSSTSTTSVLAGSSTVTVSNVGTSTGGKLLITQPAQQTGKVQIQLPPGVKEQLQQQLSKLPPDQLELYKKHQPQVLLRLQQQLMKQQQGAVPIGGITKIPITVNAGATGVTSVLQAATGSAQPMMVTTGATPQFVIKRQVIPPQPLTRSQHISQQLARDQKAATQPDCKNPFKNYRDACQRLLRFHVFQGGEPNYEEMLGEEDDFEDRCLGLLERKEKMFNKFELLSYKEAMRDRVTSESVMLEKLFLQEESKILREEKHQVATNPESFVARPSKRTKPSPETEDEGETIKTEDTSDDSTPVCKKPRYGPTPSALLPNDEAGVIDQNVNPVQVKHEPVIKEEEQENNAPKETSAYSAHSSGGLKLVIKSSPAHAVSTDYNLDSPLDTSEDISMNQSGDSIAQVCQETDETGNTDAVPFQDYFGDSQMNSDLTQEYQVAGNQNEESHKTKVYGADVSESDAAVAGLLSFSSPTGDDEHLFGSQFVNAESEISSKPSQIFADSSSTSNQSDDESANAVNGIMEETDGLPMHSESSDIAESETQQVSEHDYDSDDDDEQLVESENTSHFNHADSPPNTPNVLPGTFGGLNNEMESAINSILSLNDPAEENEFGDMDEFQQW